MPWVEPIARRAAWVTIAAAVILFLALAKDFVLPLALAILLAFMLSPIVRWLGKRIRSRLICVCVATAVGGAVLAGLGAIAVYQFVDFASELPGYRHTIAAKLITLRSSGDGLIERVMKTVTDIEQDVAHAATTLPAAASSAPPAQMPAIPVVHREETTLLESTKAVLEPVVEPVLVSVVVAVLVFLLLLYGEELRDRVVVLAGTQQISVTTQALEDASKRIGKYLLMQAVVNTFFGTSIGIGLMVIGLPNALLLGLLAGLLRFIPVLGAWLGAAVPILLAMAVFDTWAQVFYVAGVFIFFELVVNLALEPYLYGHSTGISGIAVIVAILFWTWIWGPIGLLLAVPITVCLVVLGKYIEPLRVFYILLTDEPMLAGERRLYHRLVTGDVRSAETQIDEAIKSTGIATTADALLLPVLQTARQDHERGALSEERLNLVNDTAESLVAERLRELAVDCVKSEYACVPISPADRPASVVTAAVMSEHLKCAVPVMESSIQSDLLQAIESGKTRTLALVTASPESTARARLLAKSLARRARDVSLLLVHFDGPAGIGDITNESERLTVVYSVDQMMSQVQQIVRRQASVAPSPLPETGDTTGNVLPAAAG